MEYFYFDSHIKHIQSALDNLYEKLETLPDAFRGPITADVQALANHVKALKDALGDTPGATRLSLIENQQQKALLESEHDRLKALLQSISDEVWFCDTAGNVTLMNDIAPDNLGLDQSNALNHRPLKEVVLDKLEITNLEGTPRPDKETPLFRSLKGETVRGKEIVRNARTGEKIYREYVSSPIRSKDDQITGAVAIVRDITGEIEREAALREKEALYRAIARNIPDGAVWVVDPDLRYIVVEGSVVERAGLSRERLEGRTVGEALDKPMRQIIAGHFRRALAGETINVEAQYRDLVLWTQYTPLRDIDGAVRAAMAVSLDITELRHLEAQQLDYATQMEVHHRLLEHREMERQKIARDLHDGPVQSLGGLSFSLKILQDSTQDSHLQMMIEQIREDVKHQVRELREVCNELRPPALVQFGLRQAIRSHAAEFQSKHPGIHIKLNLADGDILLPDNAVLALYRIYQEALNNIVRHAQASQVTVSLSNTGDRVRLEIRDNGQGFQPSDDWVELARGHHYGLVGMKERAEAVGGTFIIASEPGDGTAISVDIQRAATAENLAS